MKKEIIKKIIIKKKKKTRILLLYISCKETPAKYLFILLKNINSILFL